MKKCTMLLALVAAMAVSPLVVNAHCGSCGTSAKKEVKKSCCSAAAKTCTKAECKKECKCDKKAACTMEACKDGCKCEKESTSKKVCCGSAKCKKTK